MSIETPFDKPEQSHLSGNLLIAKHPWICFLWGVFIRQNEPEWICFKAHCKNTCIIPYFFLQNFNMKTNPSIFDYEKVKPIISYGNDFCLFSDGKMSKTNLNYKNVLEFKLMVNNISVQYLILLKIFQYQDQFPYIWIIKMETIFPMVRLSASFQMVKRARQT